MISDVSKSANPPLQVRVYDNRLQQILQRLVSVESEFLIRSQPEPEGDRGGVYKYGGNLALYFDVRPGSRDYVKAGLRRRPGGFSYCFDISMITSTSLLKRNSQGMV